MRSDHLRRPPRRVSLALILAVVLTASSASAALARGKPGYPDKISWSGTTWAIKTSHSAVGPGPNVFSRDNVGVNSAGLHLGIRQGPAGTWTTSEVIGSTSLGYGTYTFTLGSDVSALDPNVVLGLFTWSDRARYAHREIDIEVARWGSASDSTNAQYVVQPNDAAGHLERFVQPSTTSSTQQFTWRAGSVEWVSRNGNGDVIASYSYHGSDVPKPGDERVHLNLWLFNGDAPMNGQDVDVTITSFAFTP